MQINKQKTSIQSKGIKRKRRLLTASEWILLVAYGIVIGLIFEHTFAILFAVIPGIVVIHLLYRWLKDKKFAYLYAKPDETQPDIDEDDLEANPVLQKGTSTLAGKEVSLTPAANLKGPLKYILLALQIGAGALFGISAVGLFFSLLSNNRNDYGDDRSVYLVMLGLSVVVFVIAVVVQMIFDAESKREFSAISKDMKFIETDERTRACIHKAGYITMWVVFAALMLLGGAITALPVDSINAIAIGLLCICVAGFFVYGALLNTLNEGNELTVNPVRFYALLFAISLAPPILMGIRWVINGLSSAGIAFFVAYVIVSAILLIETITQVRLVKKRKKA